MVLQQKLVDFDNEIVLQPANAVALFFPRAKDAAEAVESEDAAADEDTANTATKQTFESEDAAADEETANTATKQTFESEDTANTATKQTFRSMGLRCNKSVATHLLLENAYESNLLSDISKVDYLAGNLGRIFGTSFRGEQTLFFELCVFRSNGLGLLLHWSGHNV